MGRAPRLQIAGASHVRNHAGADSLLLHVDEDSRLRLAQLASEVQASSMRLHAYCLMGNHEHLLMTVDQDDVLAKMMQRLNRRYAGAFNLKYGRRGRLYWRPYDASPVISDRYLVELIQYFA